MRLKRNSILGVILLLLVVSISIGYASLTTTLNINGTSAISGQTWDVHFENIADITKSRTDLTVSEAANIVEKTTTPADDKDDLHVSFGVSFVKPGDSYSFTVKVVNDGTIPAKVSGIEKTISNNTNSYIVFTVSGIAENDVIAANSSKTITVLAKFDENATSVPSESITSNLGFTMDFEQN